MDEIEQEIRFIIQGIREGSSLLDRLSSLGKKNSIQWLQVTRMLNDLKDSLTVAWKLRRIKQSK